MVVRWLKSPEQELGSLRLEAQLLQSAVSAEMERSELQQGAMTVARLALRVSKRPRLVLLWTGHSLRQEYSW
jgi:hypothetical protein